MSGVSTQVLTIFLLCGLCQAKRVVKTSPTQDTKTTYIGTAYKTVLGSQKFITAKFLGIPFAVPPKRFAKPVLNIPKNEVFRATKFGSICPQIIDNSDYCTRHQTMSENCLYLNIYVPLPTATVQDLVHTKTYNTSKAKSALSELLTNRTEALHLPSVDTRFAVFVFIHGGAFLYGNGNCYDGSVLAGVGNIIVVTINYRLGNLGFLSTHDDVIPGNLGLWDQYVAIQWVKQHIHVFGGDPDRITVGGQSAGSYSSIYQALYEGNKNVFHRIIAQSGTPAAVKSVSTVGYNITLEVAKQLNCNITGTKQEVKSCLMQQSAKSVVNVRLPIIVPGSLPVQPTLDDPIVTKDPYTFLSKMTTSVTADESTVPQHFISKDILIGVDAQDGDIVLRLFTDLISRGNTALYNQLLRCPISLVAFKNFIRNYFQKNYNDVIDETAVEAVVDRYLDWETPDDYSSLSNRAIDMFTDVFFAIPSINTASAHVGPTEGSRISNTNSPGQATNNNTKGHNGSGCQHKQGRTFIYRFNVPNPGINEIPWFRGTGHSSEVDYVFGNFGLQNETELNLARTVMTYWSNFVKSGDPNTDNISGTGIHVEGTGSLRPTSQLPPWHEYNNQDEPYLEISAIPVTKNRMRASYKHFWTQYIPKLRYRLQNDVFNDGNRSEHTQKCQDNTQNGQDISKVNFMDRVVLAGLVFAIIVVL